MVGKFWHNLRVKYGYTRTRELVTRPDPYPTRTRGYGSGTGIPADHYRPSLCLSDCQIGVPKQLESGKQYIRPVEKPNLLLAFPAGEAEFLSYFRSTPTLSVATFIDCSCFHNLRFTVLSLFYAYVPIESKCCYCFYFLCVFCVRFRNK